MKTFIHHKIGRKPRKFKKVMFMLLGFFGLVVLTSIRSDIYAATNGGQNSFFLDQTFWNANPTDSQIIQALFGSSNSAYTNGWTDNSCNTANMQVDYFTELPTDLLPNKIYVLTTGAISIGSTVTIPSCTAIVSNVDGGTTVYSNTQISNHGMFYSNMGTHGVIIDNVNFEGTRNVNGANHTSNPKCIELIGNDCTSCASSNISVNNSNIARCGQGIAIQSTKINYVNLTNIRLINNIQYGIYLLGAGRVSMNNIIGQSATEIYVQESNYIAINNSAFSNLTHTNVYATKYSGFVVNNVIANIYLTTFLNVPVGECLTNDIIGFISSSDPSSIKCKVYGYHRMPEIGVCVAPATQIQGAGNSLGWTAGSQSYIGCFNRDYIINPIASSSIYSNVPIIPWNSSLTYVYTGCNGNTLNCFILDTYEGTDAANSNYKYSFGKNVPTQIQPVRWNNTTLQSWGTVWNSNYFVGSNLGQITATSTLPSTVGGSTSLTVNSSSNFVSKYNVLGPHVTPVYNTTIGVNTTVNWTNGDGPKAAIFQVTGANYYAMHFMGKTERVSNGPTFTLNGTQLNECASKTWTAFTNYSSSSPNTMPYRSMLPGSSSYSSWTNMTSLTYNAGQPGSYIFTGQARDSYELITTHTATITVNNSQPTANNFIGSTNVGNTPKQINWKTASSANEGACGNGSLTVSMIQQGTKGICTTGANDMLTYTPNGSSAGNDTCIIRIKDNENSYVDVTVTRKNITTSNVYGTITINTGAAATNNPTLTLGLTWNGATKVRFSCDGTSWPTTWSGLSATMSYTLGSSYGCNTNTGNKIVYAQFSGGGVTFTTSDDIIYDTQEPTVATTFNSGANSVTVTFTDDLAGLSSGQHVFFRWQTGTTCNNTQSSYVEWGLNYNDGDLVVSRMISAQGLSGTYYLCIYRGLYDRAGNIDTSITRRGPYSLNDTGAACEWSLQPGSPIGPNNMNNTGMAKVYCSFDGANAIAVKPNEPLLWLDDSLPLISSILAYITGSMESTNQHTRFDVTYQYRFNTGYIRTLNYANSYPFLILRHAAIKLLMPMEDLSSDGIRFDFVAPTSAITSPNGDMIPMGETTVTVADTDNRGDSAVSQCYYSMGHGSQIRNCNSGFVINTINDCDGGKVCHICVRAVDDLGNTGNSNVCGEYLVDVPLPTVEHATLYTGRLYQDGITNYYRGTVSGKAQYQGYAVGSCKYTLNDGGTRTEGTLSGDYCLASNITPNTDIILNFKVRNTAGEVSGTASTWIYDPVSPFLLDKTAFGTGWYNTPQTSEFVFVDTGAGIDWTRSIMLVNGNGVDDPKCVISSEGSGAICELRVSLYDYLGNEFGGVISSNPVNLDMTAPTATLSISTGSCTNQNVIITVNATDNASGPEEYTYTFNGDTETNYNNTFVASQNGSLSVVVKDYAGNSSSTYSTGILNIDKIQPNVTGDDIAGYECSSLTAMVSASDEGCGNGSITYSWDDGETFGSVTSKTLTSNETGSQSFGVIVKDGAGNTTLSSVSFTWRDASLSLTNTTRNLGTITGAKTISNVISDLGATAGSCETVSATLVECTNATGTLNGNQLVITPNAGLSNQAGSCILSVTDGDTYQTATYNFTVDKPVQTVTVSNATVTATCPTTTTFTASTNGGGTLSVSSSDTSVATVSINGGTVTVTPKKAGTATITVTAAATSNYSTGTATVSLTVNRGTQTVTVNPTSLSLTYPTAGTFTASTVTNGGALTVSSATTSVATATISNGTVTVTPVNVGTSNITVTAARTDCYDTGTASLTATINSGTITASASNKTATYSGSAISPNTVSVTAPSNGYTVKYGTTAGTYTLNSPQTYTNAGTYTIYYQVTAANYNTKTGSYTLTINKANASCPTLTDYNAAYDGGSHTIGVSGGGGGTVQYRTSTNGSWSNTNPSAKDVSTTTVYVQMSGDSNHNTVDCGSKTLKITAKSIAVSWGTVTWTYDGNAHSTTATAATSVNGETMTLSISNNSITNAGTQGVTASCSGVSGGQGKCSNYTLTSTSNTLTVNKAAATCPTLTAYNGTYDGASHTITVGSNAVGGTVQYRTSTSASWSNTKPSAIDVTNTTVYVQVSGDSNHTTKDCGSTGLTITKKAITIKASNQSKTWDGSALNADGTCEITAGGKVSSHSLSCTSNGSQTAAGSSTKTLSTAKVMSGSTDVSSNYEITKQNGTLTVIKAKTATVGSCNSLTYNGNVQTLATGGTYVTYTNNTGKDATGYTVTVTTDANHQFSDGAESKTLSCTINRQPIAEPSCTSATYNGSSQTLLAAKTSGGYTNEAITGTNAGSYSKTLVLNSNYQWSAGSNVTGNRTKTCTIAQYNLSNATATIAAQTYNGSALTPAPTVKMGSTTIASSEYTVTYSNNTNAGTANFTVTAKSTSTNYTGSTGGTFTIIDNTPPTCTITEAACTSGSLRLTLTGSENLITPNGWNKTNDTTYWKDVTSNNSVSVIVTDINGNTGTCSITPTHYDKTAPTTTASGVPSGWTGSDLTVTLSAGSNGCDSINTTYYCVDTNNSCTPSTQGTSVSVTCGAGSKCTKYVRYYSKDGLGNTETTQSKTVKIDKEGPTFTFSNNSGAECVAGSLSITSASDNNGVGLASSAYKFGGGSWGTSTSTGIAAQQPGSVTITGYVRDSLENERSATATYTFNDVAPTANNITVNNVGTGKTVNWKTLSNATEGNCGNGALSGSLKTNASSTMGTCSVNGDNISFVATGGASGSASCVIAIKDNENSTKEITVTWNDVSRPIPQISFTGSTPANNAKVTQNRFTTKMSITNIDTIKNLIYKYNSGNYDLTSGLLLMYNFDKVSALGESNILVKDLSINGKNGTVNGATWTSNGKYGGAYSFDGNDYIKFTGFSAAGGSIVLRVKPNGGDWMHVAIVNGSTYINGLSSGNANNRVDLPSGYIGRVGSLYFTGLIDEVRVYDRALSQDEIQFLYKSNLKKTNVDTWEFETINTCLDLSGAVYNYSGIVNSFVDTSANTGRKLTSNISDVSVNSTGYDFGVHTASGSQQVLNGTMGTLSVTDNIGKSGWKVYFTTSPTLVGQNTNQTIDTTNLKFKATNLTYNGLYDGITNTRVRLGNGISTTQYNTAHGSAETDKILEYIVRTGDVNDFMCSEVGTYSDNTQIQLTIPAWQIQDTYTGTLWVTLQQN